VAVKAGIDVRTMIDVIAQAAPATSLPTAWWKESTNAAGHASRWR
jgi:hypothetical protein